MHGDDGICGKHFSYIDLQQRVRTDHPLRVIRAIANAALKPLSGQFSKLYSPIGRESIPPERLMRALQLPDVLLDPLGAAIGRADRQRSAGLGIEDAVWDATTFTKNRDWLLEDAGWRASSLPRCCHKTRSKGCCRATTSRSTEYYWEPGRARRASAPKMARTSRRARGATVSAISMASAQE
jgi:hypothetical protein